MYVSDKHYLGIDMGSVSLDVVVLNDDQELETFVYRRTQGEPLPVLLEVLCDLRKEFQHFSGVVTTGSGRETIAEILGVVPVNEILTQARATSHFYPHARTIIEIGGQDSKLIFLEQDERTGNILITDHTLNDVCAAGTGSFLDQQAHRLGIDIEETFGILAMQSKKPAPIAGRCSVFAKSDMIHLQQEGIPKSDVVAGLCYALARNFISNLGKGKPFMRPIVFQGGVAANPGVVRALEDLLGLVPGELIIPEHFLIMGAFGAALEAQEKVSEDLIDTDYLISKLESRLRSEAQNHKLSHLSILCPRSDLPETIDRFYETGLNSKKDGYLGIDVGAVSTNVVLVDEAGEVLAKSYTFTEGEPIDTIRAALTEMGEQIGDRISVRGVGVTGSGRYFIGDFVGADVVLNEITAQAKAALVHDPFIDTIIEIGGQDSKYIRCRDGQVIDFEMNKVCAAGTGSFLQEQAARLKVSIEHDFSKFAFASRAPADLGARCTVFMESDLIHYQQVGYRRSDLAAGLSYAIAHNYLEKVVGSKKIGEKIVFLGGVAGNQSVVAAFENILDRQVAVPEHHNVNGAIGAALAAKEKQERTSETSRFAGFYLKERTYELSSFQCKKCPNVCEIQQIVVGGRLRSYYGGTCGRYERGSGRVPYDHIPDLFKEREDFLLNGHEGGDITETKRARSRSKVIGIPRVLSFYDYFPFWRAFFKELGHQVVVSKETNKRQIEKGLSLVPSETCYPVKAVYGHIVELMERGVDAIFLPCEIDCETDSNDTSRSFNCPYVQSIPYMVRAAIGDKVNIISTVLYRGRPRKEQRKGLRDLGRELGHVSRKIDRAIEAAFEAQDLFARSCRKRGEEILRGLGPQEKAIVFLGKSHNSFDPGLNLHVPRKLRTRGFLTIPYDFLPISSIRLPGHYSNVVWKNTQDLLRILSLMRSDRRLMPVILTNFGCGPDSFLLKYLETEMEGIPYLVLEVDDHTGDAGIVTRIEAFLDTIEHSRPAFRHKSPGLNLIIQGKKGMMDHFRPDPTLMRKLENRTLYSPYVSQAFSVIMEAALKGVGIDACILPKPDDRSEVLGRQVTSGRECHPYIVTCGEFVKMTELSGFDPCRAAIFIPNYDGACRFSQYALGHADLMHRLGHDEIPVIGPLTSTRFDEFSRLFGLNFTMSLWKGWIAAEVLERLRFHVRPYERDKGATDQVYAKGIRSIAKVLERPSGSLMHDRRLLSALKKGVEALYAVPVDRRKKRPIIGIVGEFYSVLNSWANHDLIRTYEALGAEVKIHGLTVSNCFSFFSEHYYAKYRLREKEYGTALYYLIRNRWLMAWVDRIEAHLNGDLKQFGILRAKTILDKVRPFLHYDIDPILATLTARVQNFAEEGLSGINNIYVLNCMLGNTLVPIFKKALKPYKNLPVLNAVYDGQKQTNMKTRIEAFVHQARLYQERNAN
ncbi:MAG: acyl-CoA dehydratase activase [Pseudomonadota bacterium]